jgi:hypothetical protein
MKANELRIGSIVKSLVNDEDFSIVEEIGHRASLGHYVSLNNQHSGVWLEHQERDLILGIPLTEEWLLNFGFYKSDNYGNDEYRLDGYSYFRGSFYISDCDECGESVEINFVHELQNLYWCLCKKELTMK